MKTVCAIVGVILGTLLLGFLVSAGVIWGICWALPAIGVTTIFGWTVAFSWKLVILLTLVQAFLRGIFSSRTTVKTND